jgi:hypothetical protein
MSGRPAQANVANLDSAGNAEWPGPTPQKWPSLKLRSTTSTCDRHHVDVFAYVHDLLGRMAHDPHPAPEVLRAWLPDNWRPPPSPPESS